MFRRHWWVIAAFAALTVALTWPLPIRAANHQLGGGLDPWLFIWTIGWDVHALTHAPLSMFDANIFFPYQNTLAYSEHLIGTVVIAAPVIWLTGNPLLATNLVALSSVLLCALGGYVLGLKLGLSRPSAFLCGLIFAFTPPRFGRIYQLHLTTIYWVPFGLAFLYAYLKGGRGRDLKWAAAFLTLQALTSGHGAALLTLGAVILIAHHVASGNPLLLRKRIGDAGVTGLLLLTPIVLVMIPYWRARREVGLVRQLDDAGIAASSWVTSNSWFQTWLLARLPDWPWLRAEPDVILFPGFIVLLLAACAVWTPRAARVWLIVLIVAVWMTIGPPYGLWQWVYWVPGLSFIRVPSRFMLLGMLALAVLAALGFERIASRLTPRVKLITTVVTVLLLAGEFAAMPIDARPYPIVTPAIDRWVATLPKPFSLTELPIPQSSQKTLVARRSAIYMLHSMEHFQPIVQGYSGIEPPGYEALERKLMLFPDATSMDALVALKVTYAIVHMDYYAPELRDYAKTGIARLEQEGRIRLVHAEGDGRVYAIQR